MSAPCINQRACSGRLSERPTLTRDEWRSHPNYPAQVLLVGSHQNFRHISRSLVHEAASGGLVRPVGTLYMRWRLGMRNHEAYEERKLYPFLRRRFCVTTEDAERGHEALHAADEQVRAVLSSLVLGGAERADETLHKALAHHDQILHAHLDLEEELVIPLLLALSPEEFEEYYHTSIEVLLERLDQREQDEQNTISDQSSP